MDFRGWVESLTALAGDMFARAQSYVPLLVIALGLVALGWAVGTGLRAFTVRLLNILEGRFQGQTHRFLSAPTGVGRRASEVVGSFVFWVVFVLFLAAATDALGLPVLSTWLSGLSQFLPRLLLATLIVLAGILAGRLSCDTITVAVTAGGLAFGQVLGRGAQIAVVTAAAITAVDQVGIDSQFLTSAILITIGALLSGTALAFGLGARASASNIIALHYVRQRYRVGQTIRLGDVHGVILEIGTTEVVIDSGDAQVQVPGDVFARQAAAVVKAGA
jgi:hypothetical protein